MPTERTVRWWLSAALWSGFSLTLVACAAEVPDLGADDAIGEHSSALGSGRRPYRLDVLVMREVRTCFVGDACLTPPCVGLRDDSQVLQVAFADNSAFRFVSEDDAAISDAEVVQCVSLAMNDAEVDSALRELEDMVDNVQSWTDRALRLRLVVHEVPPVSLALSRLGGGPWLAPWDLRDVAEGYLSRHSDFVIATAGIRDPSLGLHHDIGGCGGTFGSDFGLAGAGWSWVPATGGSFWFECAEQPVFTHEWMHQLHFAVHNLSSFDDLYDGHYPACGAGDPDGTKWFPDTHECLQDPDYTGCGTSSCGTADQLNQHILEEHFSRHIRLVANSCRDGVQNYGETAVDIGGPCIGRCSASRHRPIRL